MARAAAQTAAAPAAPAIHTPKKSGKDVVIVACKVDIAFLELEAFVETQVDENTQTGPRKIPQWVRTGEKHIVRGVAYPNGNIPKGFHGRPEMIAGFAITRDVPRKLWDTWAHQHREDDMVKNGLIYAYEDFDKVQGVAHDNIKLVSDLAPLIPPDEESHKTPDPRMPKPQNKGVGEIAATEKELG